MKIDGHIHTPFCPHGTSDALVDYIEHAIQHSFTHITFTEHAPLPSNFDDPTPDKDSGMKPELLQPYFEQLTQLKSAYKDNIHIQIGLEVDFIEGYEKETTDFLNEIGPQLDDAILSVHFLKFQDEYCCIDFSADEFNRFASRIGSVSAVYGLYYKTLQKSIFTDLGPYKPKRIGHPTLVHKFQHAHKQIIDDAAQIRATLQLMADNGYELDFNSAGLSKSQCLEPYPPLPHVAYAKQIGLPIVFGSDAHQVKDLHQHYDILKQSF